MRIQKTKPIGPCRLCGCVRSSNFYWSNKSLCKDCVKDYQHKHRAANLEKIREYDRERANLPHRIKGRKEVAERWKNDPKLRKIKNVQSAQWRNNNIIKRAAHLLVQNAVKRDEKKKMPCEICGKRKTEGHHDDYSKPMDVRWLCRKHHMGHHAKMREIERNNK